MKFRTNRFLGTGPQRPVIPSCCGRKTTGRTAESTVHERFGCYIRPGGSLRASPASTPSLKCGGGDGEKQLCR